MRRIICPIHVAFYSNISFQLKLYVRQRMYISCNEGYGNRNMQRGNEHAAAMKRKRENLV